MIKRLTPIFLLILSALLYFATSLNDNKLSEMLSNLIGVTSRNILINSDFNEGFKKWGPDKNVTLLLTNNTKHVCIQGNVKNQTRISQYINVISGETYRLTFRLTGLDKGAFVIYKDTKTNKESDKWFEGKNNNKIHSWIFKPKRTGPNLIFLCAQGQGTYLFSKISICRYNEKLVLLYRVISILLLFCLFLVLLKLGFFKYIFVKFTIITDGIKTYIAMIDNKYIRCLKFLTAILLLVLSIWFSFYYLGANNSFIFLIWWIYFSCLHYLLCKEAKCPETLSPLVAMAIIVIILNISGLCGSLHYGYYLLMLLGIIGLITMIIRRKGYFWTEFIYQPLSTWLYYILAFVLFIQSIKLGNGVRHTDDVHHWMVIIKGMGYYHEITNFPRMLQFDNYTIGSALWGYFINRLSGCPFSFSMTNWSNTIISAACFIPGLCFIKLGKKGIPLYSAILFLTSYICLLYNDVDIKNAGIFLLAIGLISIPKRLDNYKQVFILISYFLIYSFLIIEPTLEASFYRNLLPDIIIFTASAAVLMAYMGNPNLKTILFICPILSLIYLFKKPGLFLSIAVGTTIIFHYSIWKAKSLRKIFVNKKRKMCIYYIFSIVVLILSLYLPNTIWSRHCKNLNVEKDPYKNYEKIKKCFTDDKDSQYVLTRKNFINKVFNEKLFYIDLRILDSIPFLKYINQFNKNTYFYYFTVLLFIQFLFTLTTFEKRHRLYWILGLLLVLFTAIHCIGTYVNYCLWFGTGAYSVPGFQRYVSPMIKLLFIVTISNLFVIVLKSRVIIFKCLSFTILALIIMLSLFADNSAHISKSYINYLSLLSQFKTNFQDLNFNEKKLRIVVNNSKDINDQLFYFLLNLKCSYPRFADIVSYKDHFIDNDSNFDYYWLVRTDFNDEFSQRTKFNMKLYGIESDIIISNSCILKKLNDKLEILFKSKIEDVLVNGNFEAGITNWDSGKNVVTGSTNGHFYVLLSSNKEGYIAQNVLLKSNHCYRVLANLKAKDNDKIGDIGNRLLFNKNNLIDFYFMSKKDDYELLFLKPNKNKTVYISDIKLFDLN